MTPEAQRIAIAEACGWLSVDYSPSWKCWIGVTDEDDTCFDYKPIPDYLNDLNAMHEAEKVLVEEQWGVYTSLLIRENRVGLARTLIHATAAQRAEAFLRTLNLWTP